MRISKCTPNTNDALRELTLHGSATFPVAIYEDDLLAEPVPWHWHDDLEIGFIIEGTACATIGGDQFILHTGEGFFISAGVLHSMRSADNASCRLKSILFQPRLVGGDIESVFWQKYLNPLLKDPSLQGLWLQSGIPWQHNLLKTAHDAWSACLSEQDGYEFEVRSLLSRLILQLSGNRTPRQTPSEKSLRNAERIKAMLGYIHLHYPEQITMKDIADSASLSVSECLRCFHETIFATPVQYLRQYRIRQAAVRLSTSSDKISDVAVGCGFQEMSYFSRVFRSMMGMLPSQYRQKMKNGG